MTTSYTLVLGGGGIAGIAWEIGILTGLRDEGVDLSTAPSILGTSAGSTVAAQLTSGADLDGIFEQQLAGVPHELPKSLSGLRLVRFVVAQVLPGGQQRASRRVGRLARDTRVGTLAERRAVIETRLPSHTWPATDLRIVVVDAVTGAERIITAADGLDLVDVVAASCAVPMVWPPVPLAGRLFIDGGTRSPVNLDLAPGTGPLVVLAPMTMALRRAGRLSEQQARLGARHVELLTMSPEAKAAQGRNPFDPAVVPPVAQAGRQQGRREAARVAAVVRP